ncbi:MAG TPA: protein TolR [Bdellovibrionota bacterium]|jgi:biopolymer transport protein TolR
MAGMGGNKSSLNDTGNYRSEAMLSEINVTPMVDVMLVLLIVFMISAPLMQQGIQVDLPKTKSPALSEQEKPVVIVVNKSGNVEINGNVLQSSVVTEKLRAIFEKRQKKEIFIQADKGIAYGTVATVMAQAQAAGIHRIGLVTEPKDGRSR